jgi:hypothetical protein
MMAGTDELPGGRVEMYRTREVSAVLCECRKFVQGEPQQNARVALFGITKQLVAADIKFVNVDHRECPLVWFHHTHP